MIFEIKVTSKSPHDTKGLDLLAEIKRTLKINSIRNIRTVKVYRLENITRDDVTKFAHAVLYESIDSQMTINSPMFKGAGQVIEVAYKPGVMNPEVGSLIKSALDLKVKLSAADSSWQYAFFGKVTKDQIQQIVKRLLVNDTVERLVTKPPRTLIISGSVPQVKAVPLRMLNDEKLMDLSKDRLFLNLEEMKVIQFHFQKIARDPTDCEIEVLAQTWSEHCVHKTFRAALTIDGQKKPSLISRIKQTANNNKKLIVSAFVDNSGVIDFYDGFAICGKVETHNSPSAIEPYGGAMTGSGGVFRDILGTGQGAKPIISTDIFCFAPPNLSSADLPLGCLPPDYLLRKVVAGVRDYGNRVGIPTNNGSIHFHKDFRAKPTVAVGSYGIVPKKYAAKRSPKKGDLILTIGGRTGRDGIHGATFSSGEMTDRTINVSGSAVQIGNAIEEKRIIDVVLALRDQNLIRTLTDCGAGGFSSAIGEMAKSIGATVNLEKVPLKYSGLAPWEIFLSESQERMVLATAPKNLKKVLKICKLYNVEAANIGMFDGRKRLTIKYRNKIVCDLEMKFLHNGLPQRKMVGITKPKNIRVNLPPIRVNLQDIWQKVMAHGNVCSKEPIVRMYDHNVQGTNALHPFGGKNFDGPNDGAIIRPILNKPYGLAVTHGLNPVLNQIDPYNGSIWAIVEALSNYVAIGGDFKNAALIDNFIWPFPDEESLADLDKSVDACVVMAELLNMAFVSGKDSLSSTYRYPNGSVLKIPPVLLISVFGRIPDVRKTSSSDFKSTNSTIVLVGKPDFQNLGGSTYFDITKSSSASVPKIDLKTLPKVFNKITAGIKSGKILSAHDISEGGLAAAISEMSFGGNFGVQIDLSVILERSDRISRPDFIFFSETAGTFLVEVESLKVAKQLFAGAPYSIIGQTNQSDTITVNFGKKKLV